jgi:hypothetical protein
MAKIIGLEKVIAALRAKAAKAQEESNVSVSVGYTAAYAVFVHEDLQKAHGAAFNIKHADEIASGAEHSRGPEQQAKFLEGPAREKAGDIGAKVVEGLKQGKTMSQSLLLGGLFLQRESMRIVPVDKGPLRASAFTSLDNERA